MGKRSYAFLPILAAHPTLRAWVPVSLRMTLALFRYRHCIDFRDAIVEFHRIEPSLALRDLANPKVLFLHNDMQDLYNQQIEITQLR